MNHKMKACMISLALVLLSLGLFGQVKARKERVRPTIPRWVSEKGYWVVETNIHTPTTHTIWFYDNNNVLVYKETVTGLKLKSESRRVKMKLKKALEQAVLAATPGIKADGNHSLVRSALR